VARDDRPETVAVPSVFRPLRRCHRPNRV